jgi:ribosomal protein S13
MNKYILHVAILLIISLSISGCKPKQIIQEKIVTKIDSSQVITLKDELQKKTIEVELLKTDLERTRDENIRLQSEVSSHVINYDTGAQIKPDGQYPKANETITQSKSVYENTIKQLEFLSQTYGKKVDSLITLNRNLKQSIELVTNENKSLSEKTTPTTGFNFRLFLIGIVVGILLCFILWLLIKLYGFRLL